MEKGNEFPAEKDGKRKEYTFPNPNKILYPPARLREFQSEVWERVDEYETTEAFRVRLNERMEAQGLTKNDLAMILNVDVDRVNKWCSKGQLPQALFLIRLAVILDCEVDYLVGLQDEPRQMQARADAAEVTGLSYDAVSVLKMMKKFGDPTLSVLSDMIEDRKLLDCILSAALSEYEGGCIERGTKRLYVSAETLYEAEKKGVYDELMKFIDKTRAKNYLPALGGCKK